MRSANDPIEVERQVAFFAPADMKGKWHAAWMVAQTPVCGARVDLDPAQVIRTEAGQNSVHPLLCRRCLRLSVVAGVSATGIVKVAALEALADLAREPVVPPCGYIGHRTDCRWGQS